MRGVYYGMHRIGFRRLLPLLFTLVHVVFVGLTLAHQPHQAIIGFGNSGYQPVSYQEGVRIPTNRLSAPPLKPIEKVAIVLDLPAVFLAVVIAEILFPRSEMAWLHTSITFVPPLWFGIGRWLDGLMGYVGRLRLPKVLRSVVIVPAYGLICISIAGLTPLYHHRTPDSYLIFTGVALWSGLSVAVMRSSNKEVD